MNNMPDPSSIDGHPWMNLNSTHPYQLNIKTVVSECNQDPKLGDVASCLEIKQENTDSINNVELKIKTEDLSTNSNTDGMNDNSQPV